MVFYVSNYPLTLLLSLYNSGDKPLSLPPLLFLFYTSLTLISGKCAVTVICI
jgi:hypothetical protein